MPLSPNQILQPRWREGAALKLIGLGGVGGVLARYGALFLASLNQPARFVLIEGDAFEPSNATRMLFASCGNKASVIRAELLPRLAHSNLALVAIEEFVTTDNIQRLIHPGDTVFLAVDNHATRRLVSAHCAQLEEVCLISGGNDGIGPDARGRVRRGSYGNVQIYVRRLGQDVTHALTWQHPEIENPADRPPNEQSCTELAVSVPQILFANLATASAMLNTLWLHLCGALHYGELAFDIADGLMRPVTPLEF